MFAAAAYIFVRIKFYEMEEKSLSKTQLKESKFMLVENENLKKN